MFVVTAVAALGLVLGSPTITDVPVNIGDGTYLVGTDIPAGTYKTDGQGGLSGSCGWSRNKSDGGAAGDIIKNYFGSGPAVVNARAGEVLVLSLGCTYRKN